jgi:pimeloyl-ACP methyl ester carboxylesterase
MKEKELLLHGALGAGSQFDGLTTLLAPHCRVHTLDFEGHGNSPIKERPFRFAHFAENVIEYLDSRALEGVHIFGHSMGGHVGLYLARHYPERVHSVFTFGVKFTWTPAIAERENGMLVPEKMRDKVPRYVRTLGERHRAAGWENVVAKIKEQHLFIGKIMRCNTRGYNSIKQSPMITVGPKA